MAKKIVALYDDWKEAKSAVDDLVSSGFEQSQVKLIGKEDTGEYSKYVDTESREYAGTASREHDVREKEGFWSNLKHWFSGSDVPEEDATYYGEGVRRGGTVVTVDTSDEMVVLATEILNRHHPVDIDQRASQWREDGWAGYTPSAGAETMASESERRREHFRPSGAEGEEIRIPVAEEQVHVGKRRAETGGVRVHTFVEKQPIEEEVRLREERVHVERHPVDRKVDPSELEKAFKDEDYELRETREEPVVAKEARIVEEIGIRKDVEETSETVRDTVRRTRVEVDEQGREGVRPFGASVEGVRSFDADRDYFEKDYNSRYAKLGGTYGDYVPAYQYGHRLASDPTYRGRTWAEVEPELRTSWEKDHRGSWDKFKDAIRYGWNRVTGSH